MSATGTLLLSKSDELLRTLRGYDRILVVMHDNPDPDAIASGWGIQVLVEEKLKARYAWSAGARSCGQKIGTWSILLSPPIEFVDLSISTQAPPPFWLTVARTRPTMSSLASESNPSPSLTTIPTGTRLTPLTSISGLTPLRRRRSLPAIFREQGIELGPKLATAMLYAVRSETCGHETHFSPLDRSILPWLTAQGEPALLAEIENAPLTRDYFADLLLALQSTFPLRRRSDLFFASSSRGRDRWRGRGHVDSMRRDSPCPLCDHLGNDLLISARTQPGHGSATKLLQTTLEGLGGAGGHAHRAGGKISGVGHTTKGRSRPCMMICEAGGWLLVGSIANVGHD